MGWIVYPKIHVYSEPQNVTLFGNRVSAHIMKQVNMNHIELEWGLNLMTGILIRREEHLQRHTQGEGVWRCRWKLEACVNKPRNPKDCQQPRDVGRDKEGFFLRAFRGSMVLLTAPFQISSLQSCERIHFLLFSATQLWYFVTAALGIKYYESFLM